MELDSNQEPIDQARTSVMSFDLLLNELESTHGHIEEHIRHLEAVFRASQRQRWRNGRNGDTPVQISLTARPEAPNNQGNEDSSEREVADFVIEEAIGSGEPVKRGNALLMAKAVEIDIDKSGNDFGGFFDCNICLDLAKDPILTCCGHLFCWGCFYALSYAYSNAKECPVCRGEVTDSSIIPIYGNGNANVNPCCRPTEKATMIPCRPKAQRVESVRPQLVRQQANFLPIEERFQQFSDIVGVMRERLPLETSQNADQRNAETENNEQIHPSSGRLTADLDSYTYDIRSNHPTPTAVNRESSSAANVPQSETPPDASVENDFEDLHSPSAFGRNITRAPGVRDDT